MKSVLLILILLIFPLLGVSQPRVLSVKFSEVANDATIKEFDEVFRSFIKELSRRSKTTTGFIAITGKNHATAVERYELVEHKLKSSPELNQKISITERGSVYRPDWNKTEFWIIPPGGVEPFQRMTADYTCPSVSISGIDSIKSAKENIYYTANVSGGPEVTYRWWVNGGRIVAGKSTPSITVRINTKSAKVIATLILGGLDERAQCQSRYTSVTMIKLVE